MQFKYTYMNYFQLIFKLLTILTHKQPGKFKKYGIEFFLLREGMFKKGFSYPIY